MLTFQWYTLIMRCFPKGWRAMSLRPPNCYFWMRIVGLRWCSCPFSSLTRANVFGMVKRVPNTRVVSLVGREVPSCVCILCCPQNSDAQSIFPGALPGFCSPPVFSPSPASTQGRFGTTAQARIFMQARRGQSGLVSEAENPGKSQQQVGRGIILGKDVAWCWRRCPG